MALEHSIGSLYP
ncbi:hypothetical protein YPPY52_3509, partial [Yersinia pestis PY-52]